jgi:predicted nuclease of predicted toxin-antitoxin system
MTGVEDTVLLAFAASSGCVLVTQDDDFLRLHAQGVPHAGIAYCRQQSLSVGEMVRRLILIYSLLSPEEMAGRVEFL